jgi:hypothetical protein
LQSPEQIKRRKKGQASFTFCRALLILCLKSSADLVTTLHSAYVRHQQMLVVSGIIQMA